MDFTATRDLAQRTLDARMKMHALCMMGMSTEEALNDVLAEEEDRFEQLALWRKEGLWPPPEFPGSAEFYESEPLPSEAAAAPDAQPGSSEPPADWLTYVKGLVNTTVNAAIMDYDNVLQDRIEAFVTSVVESKIRAILEESSYGGPQPAIPAQHSREPQTASEAERDPDTDGSDLRVSLDPRLSRLFHADREVRGYSVSQMLDYILYRYYMDSDPAGGAPT